MTNELAIRILTGDVLGTSEQTHEAIKMAVKALSLPSAQPELSTEIQEILDYLDNTLHPIISPDNWNVYSELHDMVSKLPSAQPERKKGRWIYNTNSESVCEEWICSLCEAFSFEKTNFCHHCGADMREDYDEKSM